MMRCKSDRGVWLPFGIAVLLSLLSLSGIRTTAANDSAHSSIDTPTQALELAYAYTGFEEIDSLHGKNLKEDVQVITYADSTIPFLAAKVYHKPVWRIVVSNVLLEGKNWSPEAMSKQIPKEFTILLDSARGFFVVAYSTRHGFDSQLAPEPPANHAEKNFSGGIFDDFCQSPPLISLHEALGAAAPSEPLIAKELVAYLVEYNRNDHVCPAWHIIGRGITPRYPMLGGPPKDADKDSLMYLFNRTRSVINAETGKLAEWSNTPRPEPLRR